MIADIYIMLKTENCVILALAITDCLAFSLLLAVNAQKKMNMVIMIKRRAVVDIDLMKTLRV